MMGSMMAGMGAWVLVLIVVVLAVLVAAGLGVAWLWRRLRDDGAAHAPAPEADAARETLRRRYAAGEIDDEEYERRLSGLTWR